MERFKPTLGTEPWFVDEVKVKLRTSGMNGGKEFDALVARNVAVDLLYSYTPAIAARSHGHPDDYDDGAPAELSILNIKTSGHIYFESDSSGVLSFSPGYDLLPIMMEVDVEAIEEELLKKLESQ